MIVWKKNRGDCSTFPFSGHLFKQSEASSRQALLSEYRQNGSRLCSFTLPHLTLHSFTKCKVLKKNIGVNKTFFQVHILKSTKNKQYMEMLIMLFNVLLGGVQVWQCSICHKYLNKFYLDN